VRRHPVPPPVGHHSTSPLRLGRPTDVLDGVLDGMLDGHDTPGRPTRRNERSPGQDAPTPDFGGLAPRLLK
jgi:hypothetical protein